MDGADARVAYFCRLYALQKAIESGAADESDETRGYLGVLMTRLEEDKVRGVGLGDDDRGYMEGFALRVFSGADDSYRAKTHTGQTAVAFFAASVFLDCLNQFSGGDEPPLNPKFGEMRKYALVKASEIRKAVLAGQLSAGPRPEGGANGRGGGAGLSSAMPPAVEDGEAGLDPLEPDGPPREWDDLARETRNSGDRGILGPVFNLERPPKAFNNVPPPPPPPPASAVHGEPPSPLAPVSAARGGGSPQGVGSAAPVAPMPAAPIAAAAPRRTPLTRTQEDMCLEAQKFARFAVSALQFDDIANGRNYLQQALAALPVKEE